MREKERVREARLITAARADKSNAQKIRGVTLDPPMISIDYCCSAAQKHSNGRRVRLTANSAVAAAPYHSTQQGALQQKTSIWR